MSRIPSVMWRDVVVRSARRRCSMMAELHSSTTSRQSRFLSTQEQVEVEHGDATCTAMSSPNTTMDTTTAATSMTEQQRLARQRKEERQRKHQALLAQQAEAKQKRLLERRLAKERANQQQQQHPTADKILEMERHRTVHKALVQETWRQYHQTKKTGTSRDDETTATTSANTPKQDLKQQQYNTVTMAIPSWLSRSPECFDMTMTAIQTLGMNHPGSSSSTAASSSSSTPDFLMDNFRRLYHQSLSSYKMYLTSGHHGIPNNNHVKPASSSQQSSSSPSLPQQALPLALQQALDQLLQAGFGNVTFVKAYQATVTCEPKIQQLRLDVKRKEKAHQQDVKYLPELRAKLQDLKRQQQNETYQQLQQQQLSKEVQSQEKKQPLAILVDWSQEIMSFVFGRKRDNGSNTDPASEAVAKSTATATTSPPFSKSLPSKFLHRKPMSLADHIAHLERVVEQMEKKMQHRVSELQRMQQQVQQMVDACLPNHPFQAAQQVVQNVLPDLCQGLAQHMKERFGTVIRAYQLLTSQTDLTRPHDWYLHARMNRRKIIYHGGPTNSGKTYSALQRLKTAERGLYLGPLRLLAAEVYDTLTMQGVYCNLLTGQEKREVPFSTHSACTIEMASADTEYDVVVIDEIQMISDESRGHAWTRALLSLRCKEIHVCGGLEAKDIIKKLAEACGDEFELQTYKRFSDLRIAKESIARTPDESGSYRWVQPGDCIVAFSRNDIFAIKREIEKFTKHKCCVIYGSLPPQTRSEQARRFNDPDSGYDVLVASDAIGMGLNLNIRRIIFHTMYKSNGERIVRLDHSAVKQIAGRAGRRNSPFPDGEVTCRDPRDMEHLRQCMNTEIAPIRQAGLMPTAAHIELFHAALQAGLGGGGADVKVPTQLHQLLPMFNELAVVQGNYFLCRQNDMQLIATLLSKYDLPLTEKYTFCLAPLDSSASIPMNTLKNFAQKRMECAEAGLPWRDVPRQAKSFDDLSYLCTIYAQLELFLWLQYKFNRNALEIQTALARKEATTAFINTALKDAEKLKLNHCYLKRDRRLRSEWSQLNRRGNNRGASNDNMCYQPSGTVGNGNLDFGELDDLLMAGNGDADTASGESKEDSNLQLQLEGLFMENEPGSHDEGEVLSNDKLEEKDEYV